MTTRELLDKELKSFGQAISAKRQRMGMSTGELAELSGMGQITIERIEGGRFWPTLKQVYFLSWALNLTFSLRERGDGLPKG